MIKIINLISQNLSSQMKKYRSTLYKNYKDQFNDLFKMFNTQFKQLIQNGLRIKIKYDDTTISIQSNLQKVSKYWWKLYFNKHKGDVNLAKDLKEFILQLQKLLKSNVILTYEEWQQGGPLKFNDIYVIYDIPFFKGKMKSDRVGQNLKFDKYIISLRNKYENLIKEIF